MQYLKSFAPIINRGDPGMRDLKEGLERGYEAA